MIRYFLRPGGAYVRIDESIQIISIVLNLDIQKTLSIISNSPDYYNKTIHESTSWEVSNQETFETNRNIVLNYLSNK